MKKMRKRILIDISGSSLPQFLFLLNVQRGSHVNASTSGNYLHDQASTTYFPFLSIESNMALASSSVFSPWALIASFSDFLTSLGMFFADPEMKMLAPYQN
jgi:hypothetical protein